MLNEPTNKSAGPPSTGVSAPADRGEKVPLGGSLSPQFFFEYPGQETFFNRIMRVLDRYEGEQE